ncbi:hypothetical protein BaRGS_00033238 [Batillaria attramentaria]|uniref:Uncharacterized protein n=1 Tax=Batillaria attramentaria TaxID=370345 RepID=A0ABD0JKL3_9CAEN
MFRRHQPAVSATRGPLEPMKALVYRNPRETAGCRPRRTLYRPPATQHPSTLTSPPNTRILSPNPQPSLLGQRDPHASSFGFKEENREALS